MTTGERNKAIYEYLQSYPQLYSWLYFNTILNAPGNASMLTGNDVVITEYLDGSAIRNYIFSVAFMREYDSDGTSDINQEAMAEAGNFISWLAEQEENGNYPVFADNEVIQGITVNDLIPNMAVDQESGIARYTLTVVITYLSAERSEKS